MAEQQIGQPASFSTGAYQFAEAQQIGTVVKEYKSSTFMKSMLGGILNILGGFLILWGVVVLVFGVHTFSAIRSGLFLAAAGIAALSWGIYLARTASHNKKAHIYVGTDGLMRVKGAQAEAMRWDTVAEVQKTFVQSNNNYFLRAYHLLRRDGAVLTIEKSYKDFNELGTAIEDEVTRRLLPGALAAYNSGGPVSFGAIQVSLQGIHVQKQNELKTLAWNEFNGYKVYDGRLKIQKRDTHRVWETILIPQVPNLCVLQALTQYITNGTIPVR